MIVKNIAKTLGKKEVLSDVSFSLTNGNKVGLIGANGAGKTTLLKILYGDILQDAGTISGAEKLSYLKQEIALKDYDLTVLDFLRKETGMGELENHLHELENNLTEDNMDEYDEALNKFLYLDGYNFEDNVKKLMSGLAFTNNLNSKVGILSGGQKIKILLASILLGDGDILLLDEPTNNLDMQSVDYLEQYLKSSSKSMIIVSHDEKFLSSVTNKTIELKNGVAIEYPFAYDVYLKTMDDKYKKDYANYQATIEKQKELQSKIQAKQRSSVVAHSVSASDNDKVGHDYSVGRGENKSGSVIRRLTKELESTKLDPEFREKEKLTFEINETKDNTSRDILLTELVCGYDSFKTPKISLDIRYGDRVLIEGANGSGKTTFIKTILNENLPLSGNLKIGSGVRIGYIEQNTIVSNGGDLTLLEYVTDGMKEYDKAYVFQVLKNFHINYEDKDKPFSEFSAGQRTKINLAKLSLNATNTLILDEPTNHLDIEASNVLYDALDEFGGTIIAISHNKTLRNRLKPNIILNIETGLPCYREHLTTK